MSPIITIADDAIEPLNLAEIKQQLRLEADYHEEDDLLGMYLLAAREYAERFTNRQIIRATVKEYFTCFKSSLTLSVSPFVEITSVKYFDKDNVQQNFTADFYSLNAKGVYASMLVPDRWDVYRRHDAVEVVYEAGYLPGRVPAPIRQAMLLMISSWYTYREDSKRSVPSLSDTLLYAHTLPVIG